MFNRQGALRNIRGMFQQSDVARHKRRSGKAKYLPERKIPWHDGQNGSDGKITYETFLGPGFDDFVGEEALGIIGVIAAASGTLDGLGDSGLVGLAHLERHQVGELIFVALEYVGGLAHAAGALAKGSLALGAESGDS